MELSPFSTYNRRKNFELPAVIRSPSSLSAFLKSSQVMVFDLLWGVRTFSRCPSRCGLRSLWWTSRWGWMSSWGDSYDGFGGGVMSEGGGGWGDVGVVFGFVDGRFGWGVGYMRNNMIDGLRHDGKFNINVIFFFNLKSGLKYNEHRLEKFARSSLWKIRLSSFTLLLLYHDLRLLLTVHYLTVLWVPHYQKR